VPRVPVWHGVELHTQIPFMTSVRIRSPLNELLI
jgi:hypothetical protein